MLLLPLRWRTRRQRLVWQSKMASIKANKNASELRSTIRNLSLPNGLEVDFFTRSCGRRQFNSARWFDARKGGSRTGFVHLRTLIVLGIRESTGKGGLDKLSARIGGSGANGSTE